MDKDIESGPRPEGPRERKSNRVSLQAEVKLRRSGHHHFLVNVHDISPEGCKLEFVERPRLDIESFGEEPREYFLSSGFLPPDLVAPWKQAADLALEGVRHAYDRAGDVAYLRVHGD